MNDYRNTSCKGRNHGRVINAGRTFDRGLPEPKHKEVTKPANSIALKAVREPLQMPSLSG